MNKKSDLINKVTFFIRIMLSAFYLLSLGCIGFQGSLYVRG
jgi:hypothetical protein